MISNLVRFDVKFREFIYPIFFGGRKDRRYENYFPSLFINISDDRDYASVNQINSR